MAVLPATLGQNRLAFHGPTGEADVRHALIARDYYLTRSARERLHILFELPGCSVRQQQLGFTRASEQVADGALDNEIGIVEFAEANRHVTVENSGPA